MDALEVLAAFQSRGIALTVEYVNETESVPVSGQMDSQVHAMRNGRGRQVPRKGVN